MKIIITLLLLSLNISSYFAQEAAITAGGNASGVGGSTSYSVGQITYTTAVGVNGSSAQGVQQAFEISVTTGIAEANGIQLGISSYPNPSTEFLMLKIENYNRENLTYQLFDMSGKLLDSNAIEASITSIKMDTYENASYILSVIEKNKEIKTFKIIKR